MSDYKISARIDLDQAQKDWDKLVAMANAAAPKIEKALKSPGGVATEKQTQDTKKTTKAFADLTRQTDELIQRMDRLTKAKKIDTVATAKAQREAKELSKELRNAGKKSAKYNHQLDKLTAATTTFSGAARKAQEATAGWWKRFGAVAVGFGVAYRAINVLENGIAAYVDILREGLTAQDEFIELQGKLAMYSQLYASNAKDFAHGFQLATVNIAAFRKELPMAISGVGDLTQGIDEFVQHGYAIGPMTAHGMVNFLDFTSMVATTVGATSKQIRQEIQSLFEGTIRPGNTVLRLLKSLLPNFDAFLDRLRGTDTKAAMEELFEKISEPMDKLKEMMIMMSASKAHIKWRKQLVLDVQAAADLAASMEGLAQGTNVFAAVFAKHSATMSDTAKEKLAKAFVGLAHAFDSLLDKTPAILLALTNLTRGIAFLSEQSLKYGNVLLYSTAVFGLAKAFKFLGTVIMLLPIARLAKFGKVLQSFGKIGIPGALAGGSIIHVANLMTEKFETCAAAGVDLDAALLKLQETLRVQGESVAVKAIQIMVDDGYKASEILGLIAAKWDKASIGGKAFRETIDELGITFDKTTVLGKLFGKMLDDTSDKPETMEDFIKEQKKWLEVFNENLGAAEKAAEAMKILKGVTLSFYADTQKAAKSGDVDNVLKLYGYAAIELDEKLKDVNDHIKILQDAFNKSSKDTKLALAITQLRLEAEKLETQIKGVIDEVPLFVATINSLHNTFTKQITEIEQRAVLTGKDLSAELQVLCADFYAKMQSMIITAGDLVDYPEVEAALNKLKDLYVKTHKKTAAEVETIWSKAYDTMADKFEDWLSSGENIMDSMKQYFKDMVAAMVTDWVFGTNKMKVFGGTGGGGGLLGGLLGGGRATSFGGVYGSGDPGSSNFVGPLQQGMQGTQSAYSLYDAYGAYQGAGGGWGGVKAGASSFSGGGAGISGVSWTTWAAIAYIAESMASSANVRQKYGRIEGGTGGYGDFQPGTSSRTSFMGLDFFNEAISTYLRGLVGWDEPTATGYQSKALQESDWGNFFKASFVAAFDPLGLVESALGSIGIDLGKIFGYSNKKRSYLGETYGFSDYSPDEGWSASDWSHEWKDKRKGEKAFGEAGEGMAETAQGLMNALDSMFKNLLGIFDETQVDAFTTAMAELSAQMVPVTEATKGYQQLLEQGITEVPRMSFGYYISAEDEDEFKDDWRESWKRVTANIIDPIVEIGSDLLNQALGGAVTDAAAWNYFSDEMREYLRAGLTEGLEGLNVDWSVVMDQESFEAALEQMGLAVEQITNIVGYFETVGTILDDITLAIDMHGFSESVQAAIHTFSDINAQFDQFALVLESYGVDLAKYTDLEIAHQFALQDAAYAMSQASISGEDLSIALQHMSDAMIATGHDAEDVAAMVSAAIQGIMASIEDIRNSASGITAIDLVKDQYGDFGAAEWTESLAAWSAAYDEWLVAAKAAGMILENYLAQFVDDVAGFLQDFRNVGVELNRLEEERIREQERQAAERIREQERYAREQQRLHDEWVREQERIIKSLRQAAESIADTIADLTLGSLAPTQSVEAMQARYAELYAATLTAAPEDMADAAKAFSDFASGEYLKFMQAYAPADYAAIFAATIQDLQAVQDLVESTANSMDASIGNLGNVLQQSLWDLRGTLRMSIDEFGHTTHIAINDLATRLVNIISAQGQSNEEGSYPEYQFGGLTHGISIAGEAGPEWIIPAYEPQKSSFLKSIGIDPNDMPYPLGQQGGGNTDTFYDQYLPELLEPTELYTQKIGERKYPDTDTFYDQYLPELPELSVQKTIGERKYPNIDTFYDQYLPELLEPTELPELYTQRNEVIQRPDFDPETIGKIIARHIAPVIAPDSNSNNEKEIHIHLAIDGQEIRNPIILGLRGRDSELIRATRRAVG